MFPPVPLSTVPLLLPVPVFPVRWLPRTQGARTQSEKKAIQLLPLILSHFSTFRDTCDSVTCVPDGWHKSLSLKRSLDPTDGRQKANELLSSLCPSPVQLCHCSLARCPYSRRQNPVNLTPKYSEALRNPRNPGGQGESRQPAVIVLCLHKCFDGTNFPVPVNPYTTWTSREDS